MNWERAVISDLVLIEQFKVILLQPKSDHVSSLLRTHWWSPIALNVTTQFLTQPTRPQMICLSALSYYSPVPTIPLLPHWSPWCFWAQQRHSYLKTCALATPLIDCSSLSYLHACSRAPLGFHSNVTSSERHSLSHSQLPILGTSYASYLLYSSL